MKAIVCVMLKVDDEEALQELVVNEEALQVKLNIMSAAHAGYVRLALNPTTMGWVLANAVLQLGVGLVQKGGKGKGKSKPVHVRLTDDVSEMPGLRAYTLMIGKPCSEDGHFFTFYSVHDRLTAWLEEVAACSDLTGHRALLLLKQHV